MNFTRGEVGLNKAQSKYFNTAVKFDKALLSLLEKKPFAYITVSELCVEAGVNRSTFYLHYENTSDLLRETAKYVLDEFLSYFPSDTKAIAEKVAECDLTELNFIEKQYLYPYLSYMKENKRIFSTVLSQPIAFASEEVFQRMFVHIFDPILERFRYPEQDRKYVMMYYLNGVTAIVSQWLKDDCEKEMEEISRIIHECIFGRENILTPKLGF